MRFLRKRIFEALIKTTKITTNAEALDKGISNMLYFKQRIKMKKYTVKPNSDQLKIMKLYWKLLQGEIKTHNQKVRELEESLEEQTGIKGVEFFMSEYGSFCGIGNADKTMALIHDMELE